GTILLLPPGSYRDVRTLRIRAKIEGFNRERYQVGPRWTDGWLARVQQLAPVVATDGTIEVNLFAAEPAKRRTHPATGRNTRWKRSFSASSCWRPARARRRSSTLPRPYIEDSLTEISAASSWERRWASPRSASSTRPGASSRC